MTRPKLLRFNLNPPDMEISNNWFEDEITCYRKLGAFKDITIDLLTIAYRKYSVDKSRQKRKYRKMYKL